MTSLKPINANSVCMPLTCIRTLGLPFLVLEQTQQYLAHITAYNCLTHDSICSHEQVKPKEVWMALSLSKVQCVHICVCKSTLLALPHLNMFPILSTIQSYTSNLHCAGYIWNRFFKKHCTEQILDCSRLISLSNSIYSIKHNIIHFACTWLVFITFLKTPQRSCHI